MGVFWGVGSSTNRRERDLVLRHRWYAGGIATILSGALLFSGMSPANADATATPSPTPTESSTVEPTVPEATEPPADDQAPPAEESTPPADESTPAEEEGASSEEESAPSTDETAPPAQEETAADTEQDAVIAPLAVPDPGPSTSVIAVKVGSDRIGIDGVSDLAGTVLHLQTDSGGAPSGTRADGVAGDGAGWARCVSDADGDCSFTVPDTGNGQANRNTRPWVVQYSAPVGYYTNPQLRVGDAFGAGSSLAYVFQLRVGLIGGESYSSLDAADLMRGGGGYPASGGVWQQSRVNPTLTPSCGLDVALILDVSGSVGDALPELKAAANTFVDSLEGTPSSMSLFSFSWQTPGSQASANVPALQPVSTTAQGTAFKNLYAGWGSEGGTNWDRGLGVAAANNTADNHYDVAVIITDGNPTTYDQPYLGNGNDNRNIETENGIFSANALKAADTRVIAFGVGVGATGATNALNLRAISGTTAFNGSNGSTADYYQTTDYAAVGSALRALALGNCEGTLSVTKQIVPATAPAGSTDGAVPAGAGWKFDTAVVPPVTPASDSETTTDDGTGTVAFPLTFPGGTSTGNVTVTETQQAGYTLQQVGGANAVCTNQSTGAPVAVTNSGALGFTVDVPSTELVNCTVYNRAPGGAADVTVTKTWVINGTPYANGSQPGGISAQLLLTGPGDASATPQGWGVTRTGYTQGGSATISETLSGLDPESCTNVATVTSVNGQPVSTPLGAGYALSLTQEHNTATITNTVRCDTDDVGIVKTASGLPESGSVEPGDSFDYVLTVTNYGTRAATDVRVTDDDLNDRLEITGLTVDADPAVTWGPEPGYVGNVVDLTIDSLGVGESATITVSVTFLPADVPPVEPVVGDDPPPAPAPVLDVLSNEACVSLENDDNPENDCDDLDIPVRDLSAVVYTRCVADAPLLGWTIVKSNALLAEPIDFLWQPVAPQPGTTPPNVSLTQPGGTSTWSDEIEWPGTAFTPSGISIDYPGWRALQASDYAPGGGYYLPGTTTVMTPAEEAQFVFNGLILDPSELDYSWRNPTTVTFTVNPQLVFEATYPAATEGCAVARHTEVQIEKTASVQRTQPGRSFTYDLAVANVSDDSAADGVVVTDEIPADLKITDVTWNGKGSADVFPNWSTCAVSGQNGAGYGGTLTCELFGPLQPIGSDNGGASEAPTIRLTALVNPATKSSVITNVGVVDYHTFGDPEDAGRDSDDAVVLLSALPATGGSPMWSVVLFGFLALLAGGTAVLVRRRRGEEKPTR